jgi:predicted nucleic acid-binding protein
MNDRHLYDTRFFFDYFYSDDIELIKKLKQDSKATKEKLVSIVTIHELHRIGMKRSGKDIASLRSHTINAEFSVVGVDYAIAVRSAELRSIYRMPMADSIIAATAQMYECTLISDDSHFKGIPNLKTKWYS